MADYELQGEITTNTIDSEILSAPIIESEMMLGDTVVIDHYYNGLESDTVKVTVDNDNNTIKADAVVDEKPTKNSNHLVTSGTIQNTNVMRNYVHLSSAASYNDVYTLLDNGNGCGIIPRISDTFIPFPDYLPPSPFAGQSVGDLTLFARITGRSSGTNLELEFTLLTLYGLEPAYKLNAYSHGTSGWTNTGWYKYDAAVLDFAESEYQKSKNLFNAPSITLPTGVTYNSSTNTFTYTSGEVAEGATVFAQLNNVVMPAGNYVYSFNSTSTITGDTTYIVAKLTSTGGYESQIATKVLPAGKVSIPFTLAEDTYIGLCWYYKTGWSAGSAPAGSKTISNVQLEQGSTATDYQPYHGSIVHQGDIAPVVLYDKNSANANINWGYTNGISTSTGLTLEDKDFNGYSRLRCYFTTEGTRDKIYNGVFIVDVDLTEQVNILGNNNYYCGIASTVTPYSLTADNYFEIAICRVGVDSTKSKITFGEYGWNKTAVIGRGTPCYKIEGVK